MGYRPAMFPEHYDADGADATRGAHGLPPKVSLLSVYDITVEKLPKFYDIIFFSDYWWVLWIRSCHFIVYIWIPSKIENSLLKENKIWQLLLFS